MGGCTIAFIRATREEALEDCKAQIIKSVELGLYPDSELFLFQEGSRAAELYTVELATEGLEDVQAQVQVLLKRVNMGRLFHTGVAFKFNRAMKPGEWMAGVHVHT